MKITQETLDKALSYKAYKQIVESLIEQGKTSGDDQSRKRIDFTKLNAQRVSRIEKTVNILPELQTLLKNLKRKYVWVVLSESWCGDAAQNLPIMNMIAELSDNIDLKIIFRDENLDIMDSYLTNGGRSIPKLISINPQNMKEYGTWGPRPQAPQVMMMEYKKNKDQSYQDVQKEIQLWYARDKGQSLQREFINLLMMWEPESETIVL